MTIKFGSGQTSGQPLLLTAVAIGSAQTLHTFPVGTATPEALEAYAYNANRTKGVSVTLALYDVSAALIRSWTVTVPAGAAGIPLFDGMGEAIPALIANGTCVLKAFADTTAVLSIAARVDDQAAVVNALTFGSGQTSGAPLVITAITLGTAQTLHTFPSGTNLCTLLEIFGLNSNAGAGSILHLALYNVSAALVLEFDVVIGANGALIPVLGGEEVHAALICNGTTVLKGYADVASEIAVAMRATTQAAP